MKVQTTRQFKIISPNKAKGQTLNLTMRRYKKCLNYYLHGIARGRSLPDLYAEAKELFGLPTALIQTARDVAREQYKSYKNNPNNHRFPHFRGLATTRYDKRTISFKAEEGGTFQLWVNIATVNGRVRVPIAGNPEHVKELLGRPFLAAHLLFKASEYFLHVIFQDEVRIPPETEFQHFIGVDRGSHNNIATVVVQNKAGTVLESKFYSAKPVLEKRRRFLERRRALGKKKLLKEIKLSRGKERNYIKDRLHKVSTDIVRIAARYPGAVIVLENLDHIRAGMKWSRKQNRKGHTWAFRMLEKMLVYKAHGNCVAIRRVYPRGTSSTCKDCFGPIRRRPSILAVCTSCKKTLNADWLGAVNITRRLFYYMSNSLGRRESGPEQHSIDPIAEGTAPGVDQRLVARLAAS